MERMKVIFLDEDEKRCQKSMSEFIEAALLAKVKYFKAFKQVKVPRLWSKDCCFSGENFQIVLERSSVQRVNKDSINAMSIMIECGAISDERALEKVGLKPAQFTNCSHVLVMNDIHDDALNAFVGERLRRLFAEHSEMVAHVMDESDIENNQCVASSNIAKEYLVSTDAMRPYACLSSAANAILNDMRRASTMYAVAMVLLSAATMFAAKPKDGT